MNIGEAAPSFSLTDKDGKVHTLASLARAFTVLFFYPKDDTPGCTVEAKEMSERLALLEALDAAVVGISGGTDKTKAKFCAKHDLSVLLLTDPDFETARAYESYGEKSFMGKRYLGILRNTFILDRDLKIRRVFTNVKPAGHADEVIAALRDLRDEVGAGARG